MKGGYKIINLKGKTITGVAQTIAGLHDKIAEAEKVVLLENCTVMGYTVEAVFCSKYTLPNGAVRLAIPVALDETLWLQVATNNSTTAILTVPEVSNYEVTIPFDTTLNGTATIDDDEYALLVSAVSGKRAVYATFTHGDDAYTGLVLPFGEVDFTGDDPAVACTITFAVGANLYILSISGTTVTTKAVITNAV